MTIIEKYILIVIMLFTTLYGCASIPEYNRHYSKTIDEVKDSIEKTMMNLKLKKSKKSTQNILIYKRWTGVSLNKITFEISEENEGTRVIIEDRTRQWRGKDGASLCFLAFQQELFNVSKTEYRMKKHGLNIFLILLSSGLSYPYYVIKNPIYRQNAPNFVFNMLLLTFIDTGIPLLIYFFNNDNKYGLPLFTIFMCFFRGTFLYSNTFEIRDYNILAQSGYDFYEGISMNDYSFRNKNYYMPLFTLRFN